jgi:D-aspartate ligase
VSVPAVVFDLNKTGCAIARCLGRAGVPVTGIHTVPYPALGARSRYVHEPLVLPGAAGGAALGLDDAAVLAALRAVAERGDEKPVLFCATDRAVDFCSRHRAVLGDAFHLPNATAMPLHELLDKSVQANVAARAGLAVPPTAVIDRGTEDIARALAGVPLPAIVKPGNSLFGYKRLMGIEATRDGLARRVRETLRECPHVVVSAYVPGEAAANHTVMALGCRDGSVVVATVTRKLRQLPQLAFGSGTLVESCEDGELAALARAFAREAGITGPVELEFKREHGDGRAWFVEANLRSSALVEMTAASGVNLPYLAYLDALGEALPAVPTGREHVVWVDELRDWRLCANGAIGLDELLRGYSGVTLLSLHAADDPEPFATALRDATAEAGEHGGLFAHVLDRLLAADVTA